MMKTITVFNTAKCLSITGLLMSVMYATSAHAIKKCQDEEGNWHYGDGAASACVKAKVTELNNRGFVKGEEEAPKTKEQIEAERATVEKLEALRLEEEQAKAERERILSVYQSEADIERQQDNQLYSVDSSIAVHEVYLKRMGEKITRLEEKQSTLKGAWVKRNKEEIEASKLKIAEFEKELKNLEQQKQDIKVRFAREKQMYRELQLEIDEAAS